MEYFTPPDQNDSMTRIVLDGAEYLFRFSYNYAGEFWTMGIYQSDDTPIVASMKIVPQFPINWYVRQFVDLPNGIIGVITKLEKIGRHDFVNGNAQFVYITKEEAEEYMNG